MGFLCYSSLGSKHVSGTTTVVATYWLGDLNCTQLGLWHGIYAGLGLIIILGYNRLWQVLPTLAIFCMAIRLKDGQWNKMGSMDFYGFKI